MGGTFMQHLRARHKRSSEKIQKQRILRRLVKQAGGNAEELSELLSHMDEKQANELLQQVEDGGVVSAFSGMFGRADDKGNPKHPSDSLIRPVELSASEAIAEENAERVRKSLFVQELMLSTLE